MTIVFFVWIINVFGKIKCKFCKKLKSNLIDFRQGIRGAFVSTL